MTVRTRRRKPFLVEVLECRDLLAVLTVASPTDGATGSLRDLIARAAPGDLIRFAPSLASATLHLTLGELSINKNLTIQGTSQVLDADGLSRVLHVIGPQANVTIKNLTFTDGQAALHQDFGFAGGGVFVETATLVLDRCSIIDNRAVGGGDQPGRTVVEPAMGGGLFGVHSFVTLTRCFVGSNRALGGANTLTEQAGSAAGGGVALLESQITVNGGTLRGNRSEGGNATNPMQAFPTSYGGLGSGGALWMLQTNATLNGVVLTDNVAQGGKGLDGKLAQFHGISPDIGPGGGGNGSGGAIFAQGPEDKVATSTLALNLVTLLKNRAQGGDAGTPEDNTQPANQGGRGTGAAICNVTHTTLLMSSVLFDGNQALGGGAGPNAAQAGSNTGTGGVAQGGALFSDTPTRIDASAVVIRNSRAQGGKGADSAPNSGTEAGEGGFAFAGGWLLINNSGGGSQPQDLLPVSIRNSTFQGNTVQGGAGGNGPLPADGLGAGGLVLAGGMEVADLFDLKPINTTWVRNQAIAGQGKSANGGALAIVFGTDRSRTLIQGGKFDNNRAIGGNDARNEIHREAGGGAILNDSHNTMIVGVTFKNNQAIGGADTGSGLPGFARGGAILNSGKAPNTTITRSTFIGNVAQGGPILFGVSTPAPQSGLAQGGAIFHENGPLQIIGGSFSRNKAVGSRLGIGHDAEGGALYLGRNPDFVSNIQLSKVTFVGNAALAFGNNVARGGAIASTADELTDSGSRFTTNAATIAGGGTAFGGALWTAGDIALNGTTIIANAARATRVRGIMGQGFGGGIAFSNNPRAALVRTRIVFNIATTDGRNLFGAHHA